MRPTPGWHGYWLNPGDAGLPMDVKWQLPKGFAVGPLRYPVPRRLEIAGPHELRLRAGLCRARAAEGAARTRAARSRSAPSARWLACTDKICVPEQGELSLDLPVGSGTPNRAAVRRLAPGAAAAAGNARRRFEVAETSCASRSRSRRASRSPSPTSFRSIDGPVDYEAKQAFPPAGDMLIAELQRKGGAPEQFAGVLALGDGRGLEFQRGARAGARRRQRRSAASAGSADAVGGARRDRWAGSSST